MINLEWNYAGDGMLLAPITDTTFPAVFLD